MTKLRIGLGSASRAARCGVALLLVATHTAVAAAPAPANTFNARLMALSQADRFGALRRAVTLGNQRCGRLTDARYRGPYGNLAYWETRCKPGGSYAVFLGSDGSTQVRPCADMAKLKLPACRPFE